MPNAVPLLGQVWRSSWHGLLVAVILALLQLLRRVAWPHDAVLTVSDDGTPREAAPDESDDTWVLIYRVDAPLFFANANRIHHRLLTLAGAWSPYPRYVVLDTGAVFHVDATAAQVLARLSADLREHHCELVLAHPRGDGPGHTARQPLRRRGYSASARVSHRTGGVCRAAETLTTSTVIRGAAPCRRSHRTLAASESRAVRSRSVWRPDDV